MPLTRTTLLTALLLLLPLLALRTAQPTGRYPPPRTVPATIYVAPTGNDSVSCDQATHPATPKRSLNGGLACVPPGGTLEVAAGTYDELLSGQWSAGQMTCQSDLAALQQPCTPIPAGLSESQPTRLQGVKGAVLAPQGKSFPGGGGIITLGPYSQHIVFEGLGLITNTAAGSASGLVYGDAQHITFTRGEVDNGTLNSSAGSRFLTISHNDLHHAGSGCDNQVQRTPPCPHCVYVRGQDISITDNLVRYCADYGLQASSEGGGLARISIQRNIVVGNAGTGIRCAATDCVVAANLLYQNGVGITYGGSNVTIANNTLVGYASKSADPWGIYGSKGSATIVNNLLYGMKSSFYAIGVSDFTPPDPASTHHNMGSEPGNTGVTLMAAPEHVFTDYAAQDYTLKAGSAALGKGVTVAGVTTDIQKQPYGSPPDLGADALTQAPTPEPPTPGALVLACEGTVEAVPGKVALTCTQQGEGRRR